MNKNVRGSKQLNNVVVTNSTFLEPEISGGNIYATNITYSTINVSTMTSTNSVLTNITASNIITSNETVGTLTPTGQIRGATAMANVNERYYLSDGIRLRAGGSVGGGTRETDAIILSYYDTDHIKIQREGTTDGKLEFRFDTTALTAGSSTSGSTIATLNSAGNLTSLSYTGTILNSTLLQSNTYSLAAAALTYSGGSLAPSNTNGTTTGTRVQFSNGFYLAGKGLVPTTSGSIKNTSGNTMSCLLNAHTRIQESAGVMDVHVRINGADYSFHKLERKYEVGNNAIIDATIHDYISLANGDVVEMYVDTGILSTNSNSYLSLIEMPYINSSGYTTI